MAMIQSKESPQITFEELNASEDLGSIHQVVRMQLMSIVYGYDSNIDLTGRQYIKALLLFIPSTIFGLHNCLHNSKDHKNYPLAFKELNTEINVD